MTTPVLEIYEIFPVREGVSKRGTQWKSQSFACKTDEQYTKYPLFSTMNENTIEQLAALQVGDKVTVDFELDSHEYNGNRYPDVMAWRITKADGTQQQKPASTTIYQKDVPPAGDAVAAAQQQQQQAQQQAQPAVIPQDAPADESTDLPF